MSGYRQTFNEALYKAFLGAGINLPKYKNMIITVRDEDKKDIIDVARRFEKIGCRIFATLGTAKVLQEAGVHAVRTNKVEQPSPNLLDLILGHEIDLVIDTPPQGVEHSRRFRDPSYGHRDRCERSDSYGYSHCSGYQS